MEQPDRVPLAELPVDWVEPGVCEETFENRRALRDGGWRWRVAPDDPETGAPSGLIEVVTPESLMQSAHDRHRDCLADPRDPWSDYVDPRHLPLDATGVPYWIHRRAERYAEWEASEGKPVEPGTAGRGTVAKAHKGTEPYLPRRCDAIKKDGTRCWAWAVDRANEGKCRAHAPGAALQANMGHQIALAKVKVMQAMPAMVDELEGLALNAASEQVRLKAITEMMDRGGVNAQTDINLSGGVDLSGPSPAEQVRERLENLAERLAQGERVKAELEARMRGEEEVVDAEVVEDAS